MPQQNQSVLGAKRGTAGQSTSKEVKYLVFSFFHLMFFFLFCFFSFGMLRRFASYCIFFIIYPFVLRTLFRLVKKFNKLLPREPNLVFDVSI